MFDIKNAASTYPNLTIALACLVALVVLTTAIKVLSLDYAINSFELKTLDWRFKQTIAPDKIDNRIVLIVYDDISHQKAESTPSLNLASTILPDDTTAKVIDFLTKAKVKCIVFNSKFEGAKLDPQTSKSFLDAVKNAGNVFFPIVFSNSDQSLLNELVKNNKYKVFKDDQARTVILDVFKKNLLSLNSEQLRNELSKFKLDIADEDLFTTFKYRYSSTFNTFGPIYSDILKNCKGVGAINVNVSDDGVLRVITPIFSYNKHFYPNLALIVTKYLIGDDSSEFDFLPNEKIKFNDRILPVNDDGTLMIKWLAPTGSYKHYRIIDILTSQEQLVKGQQPDVTLKELKDKIVLIGETHAGANILTNPISKAISGVEIQANIIDNLINNRGFIVKIHPIINFLAAFLFSILVSFIIMRLKSGFTVAITFLAIIGLYILAALGIFNYFYIWVGIVYPLGFITLVFIVTFLVKYTILAKAYEDTYQLAIKDGLTNLYNHKYFHETLLRDLDKARRYKEEISLLMVDIDFFKKFNDTYGHRAGDSILRQVSQALRKSVRSSDLVARYGGEEMAIILYNANFDNARLVAQKLVNIINDMVFIADNATHKNITISVGISNYPVHTELPNDLIESADKGLYKAKRSGRNQVGFIEKTDLIDDSTSTSLPSEK